LRHCSKLRLAWTYGQELEAILQGLLSE
jgi:hypothetical protein